MDMFALQPSTVWGSSGVVPQVPTLAKMLMLRKDPLFSSLAPTIQNQLLDDESAQTAVERGDGHMSAVRVKAAGVSWQPGTCRAAGGRVRRKHHASSDGG